MLGHVYSSHVLASPSPRERQPPPTALLVDIAKFNMQHDDGADRSATKVKLAIALGAREPKRQAVNYKALQVRGGNLFALATVSMLLFRAVFD